MTLTTMLIGIAIAAILFTVFVFFTKKHESVAMSYLQSFVGILFLFSGIVKAIDPLGTAYKIEQYFAEFEGAFEASWLSFIAPIFPAMNEYAVALSVGMIVFEIVLGLMILLGIYRRFASWAFFLLLLAFTFMTGFTYLTGYVPQDGTFFNFSSWGAYQASNMKVTDCGCFGDFLKLEPMVSFIKDIVLLVPGLIFILWGKKMHKLLEGKAALLVTIISTAATLLYCFSNYVWDLPHTDFRPFAEGVDNKERKNIEMESQASVQVTGFLMKNNADPKRLMEVAVKDYSTYADDWSVVEQIKTEAPIAPTKISEFEFSDLDGNEATYEVLDNEGKAIVLVAYKLKGSSETTTVEVIDTIVVRDSLSGEEMAKYVTSEKTITDYQAVSKYAAKYTEKLVPFVNEARKKGWNVYFLTASVSPAELQDFANDVKLDAKLFTGDDILMKTIVRSNPGIMIMDNAKILKKYHIKKLPKFNELEL